MHIEFELPDDAIDRLRNQAERAGVDLEVFVRGLLLNRLSAGPTLEPASPLFGADEWTAELKAFIARHPERTQPADAGRESIYAERGK